MKLNKLFAAAAACAIAAFSSALPVSAELSGSTESSTMPTLQAPAPTADAVPSVTFAAQSATASGGAVLGNSTQTDSASTGDAGVVIAVAGLFVTAGVGAAAVALKNKKK